MSVDVASPVRRTTSSPRAFTPMPESAGVRQHIPALDGARGLAILLVLVFHFSRYGPGLAGSDALIDRLYQRIGGVGWIGVDLFFVLSGFLITGILYDQKGSRQYFKNFYARRVLRIFPLYYAALLIFVVVLPLANPDHPGIRMMARDASWYWTYLSNVLIARDGWPSFGAIGHFWSLAVEEQFYLLWPVVVLLLPRRRLQIVCVILMVVALVIRTAATSSGELTAAFVLMPARIDALAIGAYVALAQRAPGSLDSLRRWARPSAMLLGAAILGLFVWRGDFAPHDPLVACVGLTVVAGFFGAMLVLALSASANRTTTRILRWPWLRFFGRYSYALYVLHHPLLFFTPWAAWLATVPIVHGSLLLRQTVFLVAATGVSLAVALVSWHVLEKHLLRYKSRFANRDLGDTRNELVSLRQH